MVDLTRFSGPGFSIAGIGGQFQQADGVFAWSANGVLSPQMSKGLGAGHTVVAQVIRLALNYAAGAGVVDFTDAQLASFKNALFPSISGSTSRGSIVDSGETQGGGDIDQRARVGLRFAATGTLDAADGSISLGASGTLVVDIVIPHANAVTGLSTAPDSGLLENRTWSVTLGAASVSLAGTAITITGGQIITGNVIIKNRPGANGHLSFKRVTQNDAVDTLEAATRIAHIVTGSSVPTAAGALAALSNSGTVKLTEGNFVPTFAGKNAFNDQGFCNNYLVWQSFYSRLGNGALEMPGQNRGASGPSSYAMTPLLVWDGAAAGNTQAGPVGVINATNLGSTNRRHDWIAVVGL